MSMFKNMGNSSGRQVEISLSPVIREIAGAVRPKRDPIFHNTLLFTLTCFVKNTEDIPTRVVEIERAGSSGPVSLRSNRQDGQVSLGITNTDGTFIEMDSLPPWDLRNGHKLITDLNGIPTQALMRLLDATMNFIRLPDPDSIQTTMTFPIGMVADVFLRRKSLSVHGLTLLNKLEQVMDPSFNNKQAVTQPFSFSIPLIPAPICYPSLPF